MQFTRSVLPSLDDLNAMTPKFAFDSNRTFVAKTVKGRWRRRLCHLHLDFAKSGSCAKLLLVGTATKVRFLPKELDCLFF